MVKIFGNYEKAKLWSVFFLLFSQPGDFVHTLGDAHVYINHINPLKTQVGQCASRHINTAMLTLICSGGGFRCSFLKHFIKTTAILNMLCLPLQLEREIRPFPKLKIKGNVKKIDDFRTENFEICDYNPHPPIKMEMAVWSGNCEFFFVIFFFFLIKIKNSINIVVKSTLQE